MVKLAEKYHFNVSHLKHKVNVCGINSNNVKLYVISKDNFKSVEPEPVLYKVSLDIDSKEVK